MWKEIRWWLLGLTVFGLVFFPGLTLGLILVVIVYLAPITVAALGVGLIAVIISAGLKELR